MANARLVVLNALIKTEKDKAYSNLVIDSVLNNSMLNEVDSAFAAALYYGVLERMLTLDYIASKYSKIKISKLDVAVLCILRMGLYQIKFMDKVPNNAAVNESVKLCSLIKKTSAKGFINAVLRSFIRDNALIDLPNDKIDRISVEYSIPTWIVKSFANDYGLDNAKAIAKGFLQNNYLSIRVNTNKISSKDMLERLKQDGINAVASEFDENAIIIEKSGNIRKLFGYDEGLFHVQDVASQLCVKALDIHDDMRVLDICSAPGGKAFTAAQYTKNDIICCDLYEQKVEIIKKGAKRLGLDNVKAIQNDASKYNAKLGEFDRVLCDLPCSGLGILGKKPEIRYKNVTFVDKLPLIQYDLLCNSVKYVKLGGLLFFSTCTLRNAENRDVAEKFLKNNPDFEPVDVLSDVKRAIDEPSNMLTLMPHIHNTDGFFISVFRRKAD